ncbi:DUF934 domain-containing protein [Pseudomonas sp. PDM14]|uniref:DUF934 domain-containing protein n=1 Tax=Pseudomonas sp. PDM14 TaxID=2769288 RepID=UPI00177B158A|nr:DUF934 domain-containing protein [Pseudomonas sp. PDM14]MBD9481785.1 DUF934 domain-containing protein [Pseudomonas sp. PDM14]
MNNLIRLHDGQAQLVENDPWQLLRDDEPAPAGAALIVPLAQWLLQRDPAQGLWLAPDDDAESLAELLPHLPLIAVDFPSFRDGRGYSQAYVLRTRLGWSGELRAVGDVLRDQLSHMRQCGFDAFAVRADKSVEDALKGLAGMSVLYSRSVIEPRPLFRRR